jgi:hypothetical protein
MLVVLMLMMLVVRMMMGMDHLISIHGRAIIAGTAEASFSIHGTIDVVMAVDSEPSAGRAAVGDFSIFASAFDALVGVFVECCKILPEFFVCNGDGVAFPDGGEAVGEILEGLSVEFVLMGL